MFNKDILAKRLKQFRIDNKLKQEDIGKLLNVSKSQVSDIENGKKSTTIENLFILSEHFNVSLDYLTGRTDNPDLTIINVEQSISEEELELLEDYRRLNKLEKNVIIGKISEMIYNKEVEENNMESSEKINYIEIKDRLNK